MAKFHGPRSETRDGSQTDDLRTSQILESASQIFMEKGYAKASTMEIARRARASKHTLYQLYPSKHDLFIAVVNWRMDLVVRDFESVLQPEVSPRLTLMRMGETVAKLIHDAEHIALEKIVLCELQEFPEMARTFYRLTNRRTTIQIAEYLREQHRRGSLIVSDPDLAADQVCSLMFGAMKQRRLHGIKALPRRQELNQMEQ